VAKAVVAIVLQRVLGVKPCVGLGGDGTRTRWPMVTALATCTCSAPSRSFANETIEIFRSSLCARHLAERYVFREFQTFELQRGRCARHQTRTALESLGGNRREIERTVQRAERLGVGKSRLFLLRLGEFPLFIHIFQDALRVWLP